MHFIRAYGYGMHVDDVSMMYKKNCVQLLWYCTYRLCASMTVQFSGRFYFFILLPSHLLPGLYMY